MFKLFILFFVSTNLFAQVSRNFNKTMKPKYEFGAGFAYFKLANYPGSKNNSYKFIPFPLAIYRGEKLRADEDGTRAMLINSEWVELGMSGGFNFPIKTSENEVRDGMPDTGALVGFGPGLIFKLFKDNHQKLTGGLGLRINFEDGRFPYFAQRGWILEPNIRYWYKPNSDSSFTLYSGISLSIADSKYNSFYYSVADKYQTSKRKSYRAKSGLVDIAYSAYLNYDYSDKTSLFFGGVYSNLTSAANKRSPLLENQHNYSIGLGMTWLLTQSEEQVK